jgi:hypothetical protein
MTIMTVGTALFIVAQLAVGLTLRTLTYPVVAFPMFADAPKFEIEPVLTAVTADGVTHQLTWSDFGLTHDELNFYVNRKIARNDGTLQMGASDKLRFLGQEWAAKHGNPVISAVSISFSKHALDGSGRVTVVPVDSWKAAS